MNSARDEFPEVPGYSPLARLGHGGVASVWAARSETGGHAVAIKTLVLADPRRRVEFKNEFRLLKDIEHHGLVRHLELLETHDKLHLVMEHLSGTTLNEWLMEHAPAYSPVEPVKSYEPLRDVFRQLADALSHLHDCGVLHGDLKPSNVLVTERGRVVLVDFGLSRLVPKGDERVTVVRGTPEYMSPEQAVGRPPTPASDWYSFGLMVWEALTGRRAFVGTARQLMEARVGRSVPRPSSRVLGVPADLDELAWRLTRRTRARRAGRVFVRRAFGLDAPPTLPAVAGAGRVFEGREDTLRQLLDAHRRAAKGPRLVVLRGSPGIGKTELAAEFLRRLPQHLLSSWARCSPLERVSYAAMDPLIDRLWEERLRVLPEGYGDSAHRRDAVAIFPVLAGEGVEPLAPTAASPPRARSRAFQGVRVLLREHAGAHAITVVVDDVQWAGADSAQLIRSLVQGPEPAPLLLVALLSDDQPRGALLEELAGTDIPTEEITLGPLGSEVIDALADAWSGDEPLPCHLRRAAGGNPFLLYCLTAGWARGADGETDPEELIANGLADLPAEQRAALELCCLSHAPLPVDLIAEEAGLGTEALPGLRSLRTRRLVRLVSKDGHQLLAAYHGRLARSVVSGLSDDGRAEAHRLLGRAMLEHPATPTSAAAEHLAEGGLTDQACRIAVDLAERAESNLAFAAAAGWYERVLSWGGDETDRAEFETRAGDAWGNAGHGEAAAQALLRAADASDADPALLRRAADHLMVSGHLDDGIALLRPLLDDEGIRWPSTTGAAFRASVVHIVALMIRGTEPQPHRHPSPQDEAQLEVAATAFRGLASLDPTRSTHFGLLALRRALAVGSTQHTAWGLAYLGLVHGYGGSAPGGRRAERAFEQSEALSAGDPYGESFLATCRGINQFVRGRWTEAVALLLVARQRFEAECVGARWESVTAATTALNAWWWAGDVRSMAEHLPRWVRSAQETGDRFADLELRIFEAVPRLASGDAEGARAGAAAAIGGWVDTEYHFQHWMAAKVQALARLAAGDTEGLLAWVQSHERAARKHRLLDVQLLRIDVALLLGQAALASDDPSARRVLKRQQRALTRFRVPHATAAARLLLAGEALRAGGLAEVELAEAEAAARDAGCLGWAEAAAWRAGRPEAERALAELGIGDATMWAGSLLPGRRSGE